MIASFGDRATESLYHGGKGKRPGGPGRLPPTMVAVAQRKLDMLNAACRLVDLRSPPGNRLEALRGDMKGWHSIRINRQWRIVFRWQSNDAHDVKIVDYH